MHMYFHVNKKMHAHPVSLNEHQNKGPKCVLGTIVIIVSCIKNQAKLLCKPVQCELKSPFDYTLQLKTLEWHIYIQPFQTWKDSSL